MRYAHAETQSSRRGKGLAGTETVLGHPGIFRPQTRAVRTIPVSRRASCLRVGSPPIIAGSVERPWERRRPGGSKINPTTAFRLKRKVPKKAKTKLAAIATPLPARRPMPFTF